MNTELNALKLNNTWTLVQLPAGKKFVGCKCVYKVKYLPDGSIDRFKARLVAKDYTQSVGIDYNATFALVMKMVTVRCLLALATANNWHIAQLNINNAFLHGDISEEVYMDLLLAYKSDFFRPKLVCKLIKFIYGLKQASSEWFSKLITCLIDAGYVQSKLNHSLFTLRSDMSFTIIPLFWFM